MKPRLFVIGAPKCGTTAMCSYLAEHPDICFAIPKEPKYFHTDFAKEHRGFLSERAYMRCFEADPKVHQLLAEGSVWYLYSKVAVKNILEFNSDALFVVMIRNPVDLVYSLHSQLYYGGDEDVADFETAWRLQEVRKRGERLPLGVRDAKSLFYGDVAMLGEQVERLLQTVDRDRVLVINYDDFSVDPGREYGRILAFAGLRPDARELFGRHNENRTLRLNPLTAMTFRLKRIKTALGIKRSFGLWKSLQPLVARTAKRKEMPQRLYAELQQFFRADIERLEMQIGLDLSAWKQARA